MTTLLDCIAERSTQALRVQAVSSEASFKVRAANERLNPNLTLQGLKSGGSDPAGDSMQTSLLFSIDTRGLRNARTHLAQNQETETRIQAKLTTWNLQRTSYLALNRIRQFRALIQVQTEISNSISNFLIELKSRPRLSADQQSMRTNLDLAQQELDAKKILMNQEMHELEHHIEIEIGERWIPSSSNLPPQRLIWPPLELDAVVDPQSVPQSRIRNLIDSAAAEASLLHIEKRPMLLLGPSAEWSQIGPEHGFRIGAALQYSLPILESFRASSALANATQAKGLAEAAAASRTVRGELDHNRETYLSSVEALKKFAKVDPPRDQVRRLQKLFTQGLVSGASYSEALRQLLAVSQAYNELEIKALEANCHIQFLKNNQEACFQ